MHIISISVSTEILRNSLSSAGTFNGLTSYYSYDGNIRINYNFNTYMTKNEIDDNINKISYFGYNIGGFNGISGNITNVSPSSIIYINSERYYNTSVTLVKHPGYREPRFFDNKIYENQIKVAGYYVNGSAFLDNIGNYGKLTKKTFTIFSDQINDYKAIQKRNIGNTTSFPIAVDISNYRYIITPTKEGLLIADVNITEIS